MIILLYCMQDSSSTSILQNWNLQLPANNKLQHCRKISHSRTKGNRLVFQSEALWRNLKSIKALFSSNKELYTSKEVAENSFASGQARQAGQVFVSSQAETKTTENKRIMNRTLAKA